MNVMHHKASSLFVLLVEDNAVLRESLAELLHYESYQVAVAGGAKDALRILDVASELPRLIISDILMTQMDGYQFMLAVRANPAWRSIPFLFISGQEETRLLTDSSSIGAARKVGYLSKPFALPDFVEMIDQMLYD